MPYKGEKQWIEAGVFMQIISLVEILIT